MKKILLLLANGFEIYEASAFIDVIGWNQHFGSQDTQLFTVALTKEVKSTFGQTLIADFTLDEISSHNYKALAIPGGFEIYHFYQDAFDERFLELIRQFDQEKKPIASICTGALPIAQSGVLKGRKGTTYNSEDRRKTLAENGVILGEGPVVVDENIITSFNPSTAMSVAFLLLERLAGEEKTNHIRQMMGYETIK